MTDQNQLAKVLFSTEDGQIETLWAIPLGDALYKLDSSPWFVYGVSWQDIIEARFTEEGGFPVFQRVVEKSGNRTLRLLLDPPADQSEESQGILDRLIELGCSYEGANPKYIAINIPPAVDLRTICDFLTETGHSWEHADPTYEELHVGMLIGGGKGELPRSLDGLCLGREGDSMKYKWLLLDADGTLFDYDRAEATALQRTFEQFGHAFQPEYAVAYRQINHEIWRQFEQGKISQDRLRSRRFELLFEALRIESDPVKFSATYIQNLAEGAYLIDGADKVVRSLVGQVGLVLITNGLKEVQRSRLARSTISDCFSDIVISDEVGAAKPDTRIFRVAFERMGNPKKENVLIVGDSLTSDIKGGNAYGIDACWFNPDRLVCDQDVEIQYEIRHLDELRVIVGVD